ncbi:formyltransferase family protein [Vibrio breoganii]
MIYIVTTSHSLAAITNQLNKLDVQESKTFIIYNYFLPSVLIDNLEENCIQLTSSSYIDEYLLDNCNDNDLLLSFDCFHVFGIDVVKLFKNRSANFHPSPLPRYGGINPISWGLLNEENTWAYTWHRISEKIDEGTVIYQERFSLNTSLSQFKIISTCLFGGLRSLSCVVDVLRENSDKRTDKECLSHSYFDAKSNPELRANNINDIIKYSKIIPFNPKSAWRWKVNYKDFLFTAISLTSKFGSIELKKNTVIDDVVVYYAD